MKPFLTTTCWLTLAMTATAAAASPPAQGGLGDRQWCVEAGARIRGWIGLHPGRGPSLDQLGSYARKSDPNAGELKSTYDAPDEAGITRLLGASPAIHKAVNEITATSVSRLARSDVLIAWSSQGSMGCEAFVFVRQGRLAPQPPQLRGPHQDGDTSFCWNDQSWWGEVGGVATFAEVEEDTLEPSYSFILAPWHGGRWGRACHIEADFKPAYRVSHAFYESGPWPALRGLAPALARQRDRAPDAKTFHYGADVPDAGKVIKMEALAKEKDTEILPTFGESYGGYDGMDAGGSAVDFPLVLDGRTYLARLSHGTVGWRVSSGYLLAVWDLADGKLKPLAGIVVDKAPGRLTSFKVTR